MFYLNGFMKIKPRRYLNTVTIKTHWIINNADLAQQCEHWQQLEFVALDTEFVRVNTFYAKVGLIQVSDGQNVWLIDPLLIDAWQPFADLLKNPDILKVLHAAGEDLEIFSRVCGALPVPLFDSQLAAAFLNLGIRLGYCALVEKTLGVSLCKGETRSNWCQRPLSPAQTQYAAEDVLHLARLYQALHPQLSAQKMAWLLEDGAQMMTALRQPPSPELAWQSVKLAWKLSAPQRAVLRAICAWREQTARERDRPKGWIVHESALWPLACFAPDNLAALSRIEGIDPQTVRRDGQTLLALIKQAAALPPEQWPLPLPAPLPPSAKKTLQILREVVEQQAQRLNMAAELLLRKKVLQDLLQSGFPDGPWQLPSSLCGWRREVLGEPLLMALEAKTEQGN